MTKLKSILDQRMKKPVPSSKMAAMAQQSATGHLTSFSGIFSVVELSEKEREALSTLLTHYATEGQEDHLKDDLAHLITITSEVKAINNQAALLHGERIKKVHQLLAPYRDGAFTAWLIAVYGNRQTPYNLMQYFEFCEAMPRQLRTQIELMPRQAVYVLASRSGDLENKRKIVEQYKGETKEEMLAKIRQWFPLEEKDKRKQKMSGWLLTGLKRLLDQMETIDLEGVVMQNTLKSSEKKEALLLIKQIQERIHCL